MKKVFAFMLVLVLMLSCTACGLPKGNPKNQEAKLMEFVTKHYGEAEIVQKDSELLDTASIYTLKDKKDGFTYPMTAMEVYMSDLGFVSADGESDAKTLVFDGEFTIRYVSNLVQNKISHDDFTEVCEKHEALLDVSILTYERLVGEIFTVEGYEVAFMVTKLDTTALRDMIALMKDHDDRNELVNYIMPIYEAEVKDGVTTIKYDVTGNALLLGYYDFYFDYFMKPEEFEGVGMLHDYLLGLEYDGKKVEIKSVNNDISVHAVTPADGFSFLPSVTTSGTFITLSVDGVDMEFYTLLGTKDFTTSRDEYGIYKDSFLDIMATERSGARDVMVAYYALVYPSNYQSMAPHFKPLEIVTDDGHDHTDDTTETAPDESANEEEATS